MSREHDKLDSTSLENTHDNAALEPDQGEPITMYWDVRALLHEQDEEADTQGSSVASDAKRGAPAVKRRSRTCRQPRPAFVKGRRLPSRPRRSTASVQTRAAQRRWRRYLPRKGGPPTIR